MIIRYGIAVMLLLVLLGPGEAVAFDLQAEIDIRLARGVEDRSHFAESGMFSGLFSLADPAVTDMNRAIRPNPPGESPRGWICLFPQ